MKLNKWLFGVAAALTLGACSDNFDGPNAGSVEEQGEGYIGINIQLPTDNGTRANDNFDDGVLSEYVIKDAVLLLFQGSTEASAVFSGAFTLQQADPSLDEDHDQVTVRSIRVANVKGLNPNDNLYALVMVNGACNGLYTQTNPTASWMANKTIKDLQEYVFNEQVKLFTQATKGKGYASDIFMTNSPLSLNVGGTTDPGAITGALPVLVKLDKTTYPTQSEAIAKPAGTIHVERAVGKITCSNFTKETGLKVTIDGTEYTMTVDKVSWDIAQDMKNTYAVRNTNRRPIDDPTGDYMWSWRLTSNLLKDNISDYRMIGYKPLVALVEGVQTSYYRPYFCQVPGFNKPKKGADDKTFEDKEFYTSVMEVNNALEWGTSTNAAGGLVGPGAFYPRENTFPVEYMKYANTTRVGFWVSFKFADGTGKELDMNGKNFYINGMDKTTLYLDDELGNNPLENLAIEELSNTDKYPALWAAVKAGLDRTGTGSIEGVQLAKLINLESSVAKNGSIAISKIEFKPLSDIVAEYDQFQTRPSYDFDDDLSTLNNLGQYYEYEAGNVFYEVRIKHFGDDQTPWDVDGSLVFATNIDESYGADADTRRNNFLGRYGIVRNNWYDLNVNKIMRLGYPKDPADWDDSWNDKPDDNKDQYIAVELKVLSWAKRNQNVDF